MLILFRLRNVNQIISIIALMAFLNLMQGCYYYKVSKPKAPPKQTLVKVQGEKKFIILHQGKNAWHLTNIVAAEDTIKGQISALSGHKSYLTTKSRGTNRYKKNAGVLQHEVLNEVHIYVTVFVTDSVLPMASLISIPVKAINKIELYDPAHGATVASWVFTGLAIALPVFIIIVALTKESCPFIYVDDGKSYQFIGEIYSGAIYPSLERHDYIPLPNFTPGQTAYNIKMTNEVHEIQHTNLIELDVFDHPAGTQVLVDKYGKYQTIRELQTPMEAANLKGRNILNLVSEKDTLTYFGDESAKDVANTDGIILKFKRPLHADKAKLVVKAKNTFWLDYTFTRFHELFGKEYECWVDKQKTVPDKKMKNWSLEQNIPLSVYIEKNGRWKFVDYYNIVGPMAAKEDILSLDISDIKSDILRIKLEFGFLFWDVDYAAIDYTVNIPVNQRIAPLESAINDKGIDVRNLLNRADTLYYVQPEIGDEVNMKFAIPEPTNTAQTLILHSKGYYKIILNLTGEQQVKQLLAFRKKGHFPEFSRKIYKQQTGSGIK